MLVNINNFDRALEAISKLPEVAIDVETYWCQSWENKKIIGVSVYSELEGKSLSLYIPYRHEWEDMPNLPIESLERLAKALDTVPLHLFHNAKFDRQRFHMDGLRLTSPFMCTMVMSHMVNENSSHELEDLAEYYHIDLAANARKQNIHAIREQIVWHKIPPNIMVPYACGDTRNTYYLKNKLVPVMHKQELEHLWADEETYSDALMHMEITGIDIDPVMAEDFSDKAAQRMGAIKKELGFDCSKDLPLANKLFKELKLPIYERGKPAKSFPNGRPTMNAAILNRLSKEAKGEAAEVMTKIMEYRTLRQARSFWYDGWPNLMDSQNKLHPNFSQHGTVTTRLSSSNPNMQQIPRDLEKQPVKKLLRAPKGYELWEFDYSQIEYRLAGVLSNDPVILGSYRSGSDMHQSTADRLGFTRQEAKTTNFLFIYEGGPARFAEVFDVPFDESKKIWQNYHNVYSVMFSFASRVNATAAQRGYIKLWDGRRRHFKFAFESKKAWNSLVQGGAAVICKRGILNVHRDKTLLSKMNNQVHDAIWCLIPEYAIHTEIAKIKYHLEWPSRDSRFKIDFPIEAKRLA